MDRRSAITAIGAAAFLLAACAGESVPADSRRIEIEMKTFAFTPSALTLQPGEKVTLVLRNPDNVEHEFMAGREPMKDGGFKNDLLAKLDIEPKPKADHGQAHGTGIAVMVQPGRTQTLTFVAPAEGGVFEFACFLPGHYEGGMKGALTIGTPTAPAQATDAASPAATSASTRAPATAPAAAPQVTPGRTAAPSATDEHAAEGH
jgi:uncharacterized cupredoxin-like copper-binding protein